MPEIKLPARPVAQHVQCVFFDFDGVLVDSVPLKTLAYQEIFKPYGDTAVKLVTEYHLANGGIDRFRKIEFVLSKIGVSTSVKQVLADQFALLVEKKVSEAPEIPGMLDLLVQLYDGKIPLYLVSGTPETELRRIVASRGWTDYFREIHGSPAEKKDVVGKIIFENKFDPRQCVFIGDASTDYHAAKENHCWFVGVPEQ